MDWNSEPNKEMILKTGRYEIWRAGIHRDVLRMYSKGAGKRSEVLLDDAIRDGQIEGNLGVHGGNTHAHVEVSKLNDVIVVQHGDPAKHDIFTAYGILEPDNPRSKVEVCYFPCENAVEQVQGRGEYYQPDYSIGDYAGDSGKYVTAVCFLYDYSRHLPDIHSGRHRAILWQNNKWYESLEVPHSISSTPDPKCDFSLVAEELIYEVPHGTKFGFKDLRPGDPRGNPGNSPRIIALRP